MTLPEFVSTYGYAEYGRNFTFEDKVIVEQQLDVLAGLSLVYGASYRYEDAVAKTDFTVEPFSRRDITQPATANDTLYAGGQHSVDGRTFWDPNGSNGSTLQTVGVFLTPELKLTERLTLLASARWDNASWDRWRPGDLGNGAARTSLPGGGKSYTNISVSPSYKITPALTAYYTYQVGTAFQGYYVSGTVDRGDTNFQESSLHEVGLKTSLLDGTLYGAVDFFYQDLVNFDIRGGAATPQRGSGVEFETSYVPNERFAVTFNATWQEHYYRSATLPAGYAPLTDEQMLDYAGIAFGDFGGRPNPGGPRFGIPEWTANLWAKYEWASGFGVSGGPSYVCSLWGNPDKTLRLPAYTLWGGSVYYRAPRWELAVVGHNLTSEDYFHPYDAFTANTTILKGEPVSCEVTFKYKF